MRTKTLAGIVFLLTGFSFLGAGGLVMQQTLARNAASSASIAMAEAMCREQVVKVGTFIPKPDDSIDVVFKDVDDPRRAMADVTSVLAACPTRKIQQACMGTTCGPNGSPGPMRVMLTLGGLS
jgi:hypothetical protein